MNNEMIILQTKRLRLRRLQSSDVEALIELWSDPEVTKHLGGPRDRGKLEKIFEEEVKNPFAEQYDLWPVEEKQLKEVIGDCGLLAKEVDGREEIELVYVFKAPAWGKGYATEIGQALVQYAFEELQLGRVIALIEPENEASERVALKIGMNFEKEVIRPGGAKRKVYVIE
ncbi:MAG: GNAT family N-acetyltransferase; N-acetyltransferase, partial [Anaerolineales bacterium]